VLQLANNLRTHQRILKNDLELGEVLNKLHHIQLPIDLLLTHLIKSLQLFFLFPTAIATKATQYVRQKQPKIITNRQSNDMVLLYLLNELST
jgi:hypothetical protein